MGHTQVIFNIISCYLRVQVVADQEVALSLWQTIGKEILTSQSRQEMSVI